MKTIKTPAAIAAIAILVSGAAFAGSKADIHVVTQNQYLGANLGPIITARTSEAINAAMIQALIDVSNNNYPERVQALAESILDKQPHLVALQEVFAFSCLDPYGTKLCGMFSNAFNDHLALTMAALGDQYQIAAEIQNLTLAPPVLPLPGIPLFLSPAAPPVFVQVIDRDIILARADVVTTPVEFNCLRTSKDGCNYNAVAPIGVPTAYQQLANGTLINGAALPFGLTDVWNLRPGKPKGFTCCELADLSNAPSLHDERIDVVFAFPAPPGKVKANVLDAKVDDKTLSGLWPSDHASVSAELTY